MIGQVAPPPDALTRIADQGVMGALLAILLFVAWTLIRREQKRGDDLATENRELHAFIRTTNTPALVQATGALERTFQALQTLQTQRDVEAAIARRDTKP